MSETTNYRAVPVRPRGDELLRALVDAVLAPVPSYPGADVFWLRIVCTLAHAGREHLRGERYDGKRI